MKSRFRVIRRNLFVQSLYKEWLLGKRVIFRKEIDKEEIPPHVIICYACFGDTGGVPWLSKFAPFDSRGILKRAYE